MLYTVHFKRRTKLVESPNTEMFESYNLPDVLSNLCYSEDQTEYEVHVNNVKLLGERSPQVELFSWLHHKISLLTRFCILNKLSNRLRCVLIS